MAFINKIAILVTLICELFNVSLTADFYSKPHILSNGKEDIIEANDNYTVFCQGNRPLRWKTPELSMDEHNETWTSFNTEVETPLNKQFKYGLRLYITNMSYPFVGFYICHFEDAEDTSEESNENDRIYLYVNDKDHLAVHDLTINYIYVKRGDTVVIPCRPTSPDIKVHLRSIDSDYGEETTYNNKIGFSLSATHFAAGGTFNCIFSNENVTLEYLYFLDIDVKTDKETSYIPTPTLIDKNKGHTVVGDDIKLNCSLSYTKSNVRFSWITPTKLFNSPRIFTKDTPYSSLLEVKNVTLDDMGLYSCNVSDHQGHSYAKNITVKIFDKNEHYIVMKNLVDLYQEVRAGEDYVLLTAQVWGHPQPNFTWLKDNDTIPLGRNNKYQVTHQPIFHTDDSKETLKIKNVDINDLGHYTLVGINYFMEETLDFYLNVTDKPSALIKSDQFHLIGKESKVECVAVGNPTPELRWEYKQCFKPDCKYTRVKGKITESKGLGITSEIKINATETGLIKCIASNRVGYEVDVNVYHVTDVPGGFALTGFDDTAIVDSKFETATYALGENVSITCSATASNYTQITWLLDANVIHETERITLTSTSTNYSNSTTLKIMNSNRFDSGVYTCRVYTPSGMEKTRIINISIEDPLKPKIVDTNMNKEIVEDFPKPVTMRCMVKGLPKPKILWYKDSILFNPSEPRMRFEEDRQILVFNETVANDAGRYKCEAVQKNNYVSREVKLIFRNAPAPILDWLIYIIVILVVALFVSMIYLIMRVKKERRLKREMQLLGLANFEKGAVENINPELGIDDQAELLPYDKKWEFPIEQLKLGKQLGSGAFGIVLKGEAKHIIDGEPVTTVAVKMVKKNADNTYIKALASELKIMVHLGKHLNVVNLLGACTKNVAKRELLVIVEYCRFGNLQNYLLKHRDHFINQIDPLTGKVNYLIGQELLDRSYSMSSIKSHGHYPPMKYATLAFSDSANNSTIPSLSGMGDYRADPNSDNTNMTALTQGDESVMLSNNSTQPEWRSNYKGDYKGNVDPISTKDLIAYAFQVARGMEYLATRKVLHGDLAARNILLSENNIVKICDFGLAKSMYKNDNYRKRGDCPLPVKWMAIESIRDRVFSTQSDCWSYGIVLWELFSLGRTPYPGMEADERLYHKLVDGYRLESPEYCPKELYQIMTECWSYKPAARPSFSRLTERIGTLLEDTVRKHYIDLNDPYLAINTKMLEEQSDYLSMLSPPSFDVIVSPNYSNNVNPESSEDGYMSMKPSTIFSPRVTDDEVFDFNVTNRKDNAPCEGNGHELLPMLRINSDTDGETPLNSPNGVSNPSYHLPPTIIINDKECQAEIVKSTDNYVNMPQNKSLIKDKTMNDGKFSSKLDDKRELHHYVNENNRNWNNIQV